MNDCYDETSDLVVPIATIDHDDDEMEIWLRWLRDGCAVVLFPSPRFIKPTRPSSTLPPRASTKLLAFHAKGVSRLEEYQM